MNTNPIIGTPNLLFLGAGASRPYGKKLMGEFVSSFRRLHGSPFASPVNTSDLLAAICDQSEDLEFLMEELTSLSSRDYLAKRVRTNALKSVGVSDTDFFRWPEIAAVTNEAASLLAELKKAIHLEYRSIRDQSQTAVLNKPINLVKANSHPTVIFTTNYDPAIETFCKHSRIPLTDGFGYDEFARESVWDRVHFDSFANTNPRSIVLFKLHGSADWHKEQRRVVKGLGTYDSGDPDFENVMIFPATRKIAIEEPFFTAYDYLGQCLERARSCLVIGYSFRDYDTLMRFKSAALQNERFRVAILDPDAPNICDRLQVHGIAAHPIPLALGEPHESEYLPLITSAIE